MGNRRQRQEWEQRPDESARAYQAFCMYRDLGAARSLDKAFAALWAQERQASAKTAPKSASGHWSKWSTRFAWVERAKAYDAYLDVQQQQQFENELIQKRQQVMRQEAADADLQLAKWHEIVGLTKLHTQQTKTRRKTGDAKEVDIVFAELSIDDWFKLSRWRGEIGDQQRRALGMPTVRTDLTSNGEKIQSGPMIEFVWTDEGDNAGHSSETGSD